MHPTAELKAEIAELRAEIEALKKATAKPAHIVAAEAAEEAAIVKARHEAVRAAENSRQYNEWLAENAAKEEAKRLEVLRQATLDKHGNPLPADQYRDPSGFIRERSSGKRIHAVQRERADLDHVQRLQAEEHREYLRQVGMPVRGDDLYPPHNSNPN